MLVGAVNIANFIIFYTAFLLLLLGIAVFFPVEIIDNLTEEQIERLTENVVLPAQPTIINFVIFPFEFIWDIINKALVLLQVSAAHQFIAVVLVPLNVGLVWKIAVLIRRG